jgi:hypothetical protein
MCLLDKIDQINLGTNHLLFPNDDVSASLSLSLSQSHAQRVIRGLDRPSKYDPHLNHGACDDFLERYLEDCRKGKRNAYAFTQQKT